jgi:Acetyltransferases, including N-acetylases of ribosomal proteins
MAFELHVGRHLVREAEPADEPALQELFQACADYFEAATGLPPGPGDVQSLCYSLPEGADWADKHILVITAPDGEAVGLVDAVLRHPDPASCAIGLFLLHPAARRQGLGTAVADALLAHAAALGVTRVTASVPRGWLPGERFLAARSFTLAAEPDLRETVGNRRAGPREPAVRRAELHLPA